MDEDILYIVVKKLVGNINPIGETRTDENRLENLKMMCELVNKLLADIDDMAYRNKDMHQHSIKEAVKCANEFYSELGIAE